MKISVVIPVYNAAPYLEQAVLSALAQPQTGEVLLVEDGSTDSSPATCQQLARQHNSIRLLRHPDNRNWGPGAARNLGIAEAKCPLIAFLDADDYYLPTRFEKTLQVFADHPDADGVYEDTEVFFQDDASMRRFKDANWPQMMGLRRQVDPADLFETLAAGGAGSFCTDGVVIRRSIFEKSGLFSPDLRSGQDTHLWVRMAAVGRLYPGQSDRPVSMCRIHTGNRITGRSRCNQMESVQRMWGDLVRWGRAKGLPVRWLHLLARRYATAARLLVMQKHMPAACWEASCSCGFLIRHCPQPWRVEGFFSLLGSTTVFGLAGQRMVDYACRGADRHNSGAT